MQTTEMIAAIQQDSPDTEVPTILRYLNEIQRQMLSKPVAFTRIIDPITGRDPKISFDGAVRVYSLDTSSGFPGDVFTVDRVYSTYISEPVRDLHITDSTAGTPCQIITPEHFAGEHYVRAYRKPRTILSAMIQMDIPEKYHFDVVFNAVQGYIERSEYGESRKYDTFFKKDLPKFWSEQSIQENISNSMRRPYE